MSGVACVICGTVTMIGRAGAGVTMGRETQPRPHIALASGQCQNTRFPLIAHTGAVRELYTLEIVFILVLVIVFYMTPS